MLKIFDYLVLKSPFDINYFLNLALFLRLARKPLNCFVPNSPLSSLSPPTFENLAPPSHLFLTHPLDPPLNAHTKR